MNTTSRLRVVAAPTLLGLALSLHAAVFTLAPDNEIVGISTDVTVSVQISELSGAQVGAYDLIVSWDPAILSLQDAAIGTELDGPDRSFHSSSTSSGTINLAEFSFDTLSSQSEPVVLATLSFVALAAGNANLNAVGNIADEAVLLGDAAGAPLPADISVTDIKVNGAPVAQAQSLITDEDEPISIALDGSDPNGDDLAFVLTSSPTIGILSGTPPNLTYTPNTNESGSDSFAFTVSDGTLASESATVYVTVNAVNDAPLVTNDDTSTLEDTSVTVSVLANDSDVEGDTLAVAAVTDGSNGAVTTDGTSVIYTPALNFFGADSFGYTIEDGNGGSAMGTVTVTVNPVNDAPVAEDDPVPTDEDVAVIIPVLANDSDVDGDTLSVTAVTDASNGAVTTDGTSVNYTPALNFSGADSFTYKVEDGNGEAATATVTMTVNAVNDAPVAADDAVPTDEDVAVTIPVLANDSDVDGDTLSVTAVTDASNGTATTDGASVNYTPALNFFGADSFAYTVGDGNSGSATGTVAVTVNPVNDAPVAADDAVPTDEDVAVTIPVLANDSDVDGDALSITAVTDGSYGTVTTDGASVNYTPALNFFGADSFTYTIGDGNGGTATATVTVTVNAVNDAPSVSADLATQTVQYSDGIAAVTVTATDIDSTLTDVSLTSDGLISDLSVSAGTCSPAELGPAGVTGIGSQCTWLLTGNVEAAAGSHTSSISVSDGSLDHSASTSIEVEVEDADAALSDDNILSIGVDSPGSDTSLAFTMTAVVSELEPDQAANQAAPGDVSLADVTMRLVPVGPGGSVTAQSCTSDVAGTGYDASKEVVCGFDDAPVNTYTVELSVGGSYYAGADEDVLTVFDPSLGFTTGGGWFYWPGTANGSYPGDRSNFGYTMKYNKKATKVQGSLLMIRRTQEGEKYRIKSNALSGLALGEQPTFGWASFSGKTTYLEPGWEEAEGNHGFTAYVEDRDEPGNGIDRIWIETRDKQGDVLPQNSMTEPAEENAVEIQGGNIVVPHGGGQ